MLPWGNSYIILLVSGKICLFILENTNRRSRKSILAGRHLAYRIRTKDRASNCTNTLRIIKNVLLTCASFGLCYKMPRTVIRVIRMRLAKKYPAR